jgi:hypothetical protein
MLGFYNRAMRFGVEPGNIDVMIGGSSRDIHLTGAFEITGEALEIRSGLGSRSYTSTALVAEKRTVN